MGGDRALVWPQNQGGSAVRTRCIKFAMSLCLMLLYLGGAIQALSHAATPLEQAFIDGQATAQSATPSASTNITNGTIATTVNSFNPSYYNFSSSAPEAGYFMGGNGDTTTPGAGKVTACQTGPVNPNAFLQQNCEAINYMARNPTTRPQFTLTPGDPNVARTRSIEANPATLAANSLGYASPSAIGAFAGCTTQTITTPPTYTTEVCNEYLNATSHMCTVGRTIVVDADANYQCGQTAKSYETLTCGKWKNASVTNSCTSQWVSRTFNPPTGPTGHVLSTYDDLRNGPGGVCAMLWSGSSPVSASCYPPPTQTCDGEGVCWQTSAHGGCDHLHNGGWFYSSSCYDQQWCSGDGIASITCQKLETVCNPVVTITLVNGCSTLEARAQ